MKKVLTKKQRIKRCNDCKAMRFIDAEGTVTCEGRMVAKGLTIEAPIACCWYTSKSVKTRGKEC